MIILFGILATAVVLMVLENFFGMGV
jgi:hypothetical protein